MFAWKFLYHYKVFYWTSWNISLQLEDVKFNFLNSIALF